MQAAITRQAHVRILYDADRLPRPSLAWFDPEHWPGAEPLSTGRGASWHLRGAPLGEALLRHGLRGGLPARLVRDRYLFTGWERSRAWREWRLLATLHDRGLPVPAPLAAAVIRTGRSYRQRLLLDWLPDCAPLAERLHAAPDDATRRALAEAVRQAVAALHGAGVQHPDLNLDNVLSDRQGQVWLVDFDRAAVGNARGLQRMHARLLRSARRLRHAGRLDAGSEAALQNALGD
jgi:3-deoxy-D-manno-octulosonic acid kinase